MDKIKEIKDLPKHFKEEAKQLRAKGINDWLSLRDLTDSELFVLTQKSRATNKNLRIGGKAHGLEKAS